MKRYYTALYALLLAIAPAACSTHGQSALPPAGSQNPIRPFDTQGGIASAPASTMNVAIGDAAPAFLNNRLSGINIAISEIDAVDAAGHNLIVGQYATPLIVNVLQYQDGAVASVGQTAVSQQTYRQIRFVIDISASSVLYNGGVSAPLRFVSDADSSTSRAGRGTSTTALDSRHVMITVNRSFTIGNNANELVNVDFNLLESLTSASQGGGDEERGRQFESDTHGGLGLTVRPALFVAANSDGGQISGTVVNERGRPVSNAVVVAVGQGGNIGNTIATDASGHFQLHTLASGTYRLEIYNEYTNSAGANFSSEGSSSDHDRVRGPTVTVSSGQITDSGPISD